MMCTFSLFLYEDPLMINYLMNDRIEGHFSIQYRNRYIGREEIKITYEDGRIILNSYTEVKSPLFNIQQNINAHLNKNLKPKFCSIDGIINHQNISLSILNKKNEYIMKKSDNVIKNIQKNSHFEIIVLFDFCFSLLSIYAFKSSLIKHDEIEFRVISIPNMYSLVVKKNTLDQILLGGFEFSGAKMSFQRNYGVNEYFWFNDIGWVTRIVNPQMHFIANWNNC